jgi:hypothetical protein
VTVPPTWRNCGVSSVAVDGSARRAARTRPRMTSDAVFAASLMTKLPFFLGLGVLAFITIGGAIYIWWTRD